MITGATSGIGREFARQLAEAGHSVVLVARDRERLERDAAQIQRDYGVAAEVLRADLGNRLDVDWVCRRLAVGTPAAAGPLQSGVDEAAALRGAARIAAVIEPVGLLVNAAGFGLGKPFLDDSLEREEFALDVMVRAVMATCHAAGRAMRDRRRGTIINVGSVAADSGMGTYSAHKAWVRAFSEGLAEELRPSGVGVTCMIPGLVRTEFHQRVGMDYGAAPEFAWGSAEEVVAETLTAARRGRVLVTPTLRYKAVSAAQRHLPRPLVRQVLRRLPHM